MASIDYVTYQIYAKKAGFDMAVDNLSHDSVICSPADKVDITRILVDYAQMIESLVEYQTLEKVRKICAKHVKRDGDVASTLTNEVFKMREKVVVVDPYGD